MDDKVKKIALIFSPIALILLVLITLKLIGGGGTYPVTKKPTDGLLVSDTSVTHIEKLVSVDCEDTPKDVEAYLQEKIRQIIEQPLDSASKTNLLSCLAPFLSLDSRLLIKKMDGKIDYSNLKIYAEKEWNKLLKITEISFQPTGKSEIKHARVYADFVGIASASHSVMESSDVHTNNSAEDKNNVGEDVGSKTPKPITNQIELAQQYQGFLDGYTRRIRFERQEKSAGLIIFKYTLVGSTSYDKNKKGTLDLKDNSIEFETLGKGYLKEQAGKSIIQFDNGTVFTALN